MTGRLERAAVEKAQAVGERRGYEVLLAPFGAALIIYMGKEGGRKREKHRTPTHVL